MAWESTLRNRIRPEYRQGLDGYQWRNLFLSQGDVLEEPNYLRWSRNYGHTLQ